MFVVGLIALGLVFAGTWWLLQGVVDRYTAPGPVSVEVPTPSDDVVRSANDKLSRIQNAARIGEGETVQFTAEELNAIIARHPDFADWRGKMRVAMEGDIMTVEMSVPLREIDLPGIRERWLNGTAVFGLIYHEGSFNFSPRSLVANGRELPLNFLEGVDESFDQGFNERFERARNSDQRVNDFWDNVKTLAVIDGTLVVTTISEAETSAEPTPAAAATP